MKSFNLKLDGINKISIPAARNFRTNDITDTPVTSPVTITAGSTKTLIVPNNAAEISIYCEDDVRISEDTTFARYDLIPGGIKEVIGIINRTKFYLKNGGSSSIDVYFRFNTL